MHTHGPRMLLCQGLGDDSVRCSPPIADALSLVTALVDAVVSCGARSTSPRLHYLYQLAMCRFTGPAVHHAAAALGTDGSAAVLRRTALRGLAALVAGCYDAVKSHNAEASRCTSLQSGVAWLTSGGCMGSRGFCLVSCLPLLFTLDAGIVCSFCLFAWLYYRTRHFRIIASQHTVPQLWLQRHSTLTVNTSSLSRRNHALCRPTLYPDTRAYCVIAPNR